MYDCIQNLLTPEAERKILIEREFFYSNDTSSGPLLSSYCVIKHTDTWAASSLMRENISNLDSYITSVKADIDEFN